jgi:uncharacterized Fe-S cluster-containing radical SAM superfamily protein
VLSRGFHATAEQPAQISLPQVGELFGAALLHINHSEPILSRNHVEDSIDLTT